MFIKRRFSLILSLVTLYKVKNPIADTNKLKEKIGSLKSTEIKATKSEEEVKKISESLGGLKDMCNSKFWVPVRQQSGR